MGVRRNRQVETAWARRGRPSRSPTAGSDNRKPGGRHEIHLSNVFVDDQDKALRFYTEMLGFVKKSEVPLGEARCLTVVSADEPGREVSPTRECSGRRSLCRALLGGGLHPGHGHRADHAQQHDDHDHHPRCGLRQMECHPGVD